MKPQDILFIILLVMLLRKGEPRWFVLAGLVSLVLSMPLFGMWVFFTAERLVWYAASFFFIALFILLWKSR